MQCKKSVLCTLYKKPIPWCYLNHTTVTPKQLLSHSILVACFHSPPPLLSNKQKKRKREKKKKDSYPFKNLTDIRRKACNPMMGGAGGGDVQKWDIDKAFFSFMVNEFVFCFPFKLASCDKHLTVSLASCLFHYIVRLHLSSNYACIYVCLNEINKRNEQKMKWIAQADHSRNSTLIVASPRQWC